MEVEKPLEDITDSVKVGRSKALDIVERIVRQASRSLKQGKNMIASGLGESKKRHGIELLDKLEVGLDELQQIAESRNWDGVAPIQEELLQYVTGVEEDIVDGFPYVVREEYQNMPPLKGEPSTNLFVCLNSAYRFNSNSQEEKVGSYILLALLQLNADGFVVQTGDPERPAEGFVDPPAQRRPGQFH